MKHLNETILNKWHVGTKRSIEITKNEEKNNFKKHENKFPDKISMTAINEIEINQCPMK